MYLTYPQLNSVLILGKPVEQWIGSSKQPDFEIITWIRIDREMNGSYSVSYFEVFDNGNLDFLDIYEFEPCEPDQPYGLTHSFPTSDQALLFCIEKYNASDDKYVYGGMVQEEYRLYLQNKG